MRRVTCVVLVMILLGTGRASMASTVEQQAGAIFHEYMSPYCPGLLLADCSSGAAITLREEIRAALAAGTSEAEVRAQVERRFGERILAAPPRRGFGLVAWLVPYLALAIGVGGIAVWWRRRMRAVGPTVDAASPGDPALRVRLEAELRRL
jgi:cytochrome c-type biogenesis protein CcmH